MTHVRNAMATVITAGLCAVAAAAAEAPETRQSPSTSGQQVTLTACVEKAQKPESFILTHVADVPVHPATSGPVVYWLDTVKDLRAHIGHQVRIAGTITEVKPGEMEVKRGDDGKGGWLVEIEGPGRDVKTTPDKAGTSGEGRTSDKNDIKTTLVKLKVSEITMVSATCPMQ